MFNTYFYKSFNFILLFYLMIIYFYDINPTYKNFNCYTNFLHNYTTKNIKLEIS